MRSFFDLILGIVGISIALLNPKFEPMGITTAWFFKGRPVPNWPFRIFYFCVGTFLIYMAFKHRLDK
jgi:hypothetical protein